MGLQCQLLLENRGRLQAGGIRRLNSTSLISHFLKLKLDLGEINCATIDPWAFRPTPRQAFRPRTDILLVSSRLKTHGVGPNQRPEPGPRRDGPIGTWSQRLPRSVKGLIQQTIQALALLHWSYASSTLTVEQSFSHEALALLDCSSGVALDTQRTIPKEEQEWQRWHFQQWINFTTNRHKRFNS